MASLLSFLGNAAKGVERQINPFDNGATYKNAAPAHPQGTPPSLIHQANQAFVQPLERAPINVSNQIYNRIVAPSLHLPNLLPTQVSPISGLSRNLGATGSLHQTLGDAAQLGLTLGSGGLARGIEAGAGKLLPGILPRVVSNAALGSGFNAASAVGQGANTKQALKAAAVGGALGGALPVGLAGIKVGAKGATKLADSRVPLNSVGAVGKHVSTPEQIGKALGMTDKQIKNAKATPPSPTIPVPKTTALPKSVNPGGVNPLQGKVELPQARTAAQAHLNAQFVAEHEQRVGQSAQSELAKLSPKDQELMKQIQTSDVKTVAAKAENPAQFVKTEQSLRDYYNLRHAYDQSLGIPTAYRKNYLRDLIQPTETDAKFAVQGGNKLPGYTKEKTVPGITNVAEGLQRDIAGASFNHAKLTYAKGLENAYPGQISRGSPIIGKDGVSQQLLTPYGNELFASKDLAKTINARQVVSKSTGALGVYDKANAMAKYVKLSGGAFHALTEGGNFLGQQLTSGKFFTEPGSSAKLFKAFFSSKTLNNEVGKLRANGTFDKAQLAGLTWKPGDIKADINITPTSQVAKYTGIKALHDATFQREIPYLKLKIFEQKTQGLDIHNPEDLAKMRTVAKSINQGIGGVNRAVEGMTPGQAKLAARFLLATDFTEGKIRTIGAALTKGGEEGKIARQIIAGKAVLFAGLATAGGAVGGEFTGKDPQQVAQNILGKFINPTFKAGGYTASLPATHVSEFTKPFKSFVDGSADKFSGIKDYGTARLAAIPAEVNQITGNRDYSGQKIYGKQTKKKGGGNISGPQVAVNVAKGVLPIPFNQATTTIQGKQNIPAAIANVAGLRVYPTPAPKASPSTPGYTTSSKGNAVKLTKRQATATNPDELTRWNGLTAKARTNVQTSNPDKYIRDQSLKIQQEQAQGNLSQAVKDQVSVAKTQIYQNYNKDTVQAYRLTGADFKYYLAQASPQQISQLQNLDAQIVNNGLGSTKFTKATGYASKAKSTKSTKTSKVAKTSFSGKGFKTASSAKIAKPKGIAVRKLAAPSFKTSGSKKLAVSKIPTSYKGKRLA